jgi:hypothetical protein
MMAWLFWTLGMIPVGRLFCIASDGDGGAQSLLFSVYGVVYPCLLRMFLCTT